MSEWTKGADGHYIVWNRPPQYLHGVVSLLLPGEGSLAPGVMSKRRREFLKLQRRELKRKKKDGRGL
jgi:hypothetical protein